MKKLFTLIFCAVTAVCMHAENTSGTTLFTSPAKSGGYPYNSNTNNSTYRIPAIMKASDGMLYAICDNRRNATSGDIGSGRIDVVCRTLSSSSNSTSWTTSTTIKEGQDNFGYGDAAVVCDRESGKMLMLTASGSKSYGNDGVQIYSFTKEKDGQWTTGTDITSTITSAVSGLTKKFVTSGRICQSSQIKKGDYYRLYAALTCNLGSVVIYSDDFGTSWSLLGANNCCTGGDEAKVEELPDGNVLLCAKVLNYTGRYFNIFTYTDKNNAQGSWSTAQKLDNGAASCNGEILIVPAKNASTQKDAYVALLSVPNSNGSYKGTVSGNRKNVTIYYKPLNSKADFDQVSDFTSTSNWTAYQVSSTSSAYSTMTLADNGEVAFLYEENYKNYGNEAYDIVYKSFSLSTITSSAYTYNAAVDRTAFLEEVAEDTDDAEETDPWVNKVVVLKANIDVKSGKNTTTTSYYLRNVEQDGTPTLKAVESSDVTGPLDYSYYWVISKDPQGDHYYLSSYQGDGYLGKGKAWDYANEKWAYSTVACTDDYNQEFLLTEFSRSGTIESGKTAQTMDGYALRFTHTDNKYRWIAVCVDGSFGWYDHTTKGEYNSNNSKYWATDFDIIEVDVADRSDSDTTTENYGTLTEPKHFGWKQKFTRSDDDRTLWDGEDYNYYATLKLPFAVALPENVEAYKCTGPKSGYKEVVGMEKLKLPTVTMSNGTNAKVLPRETPVLLCMTRTNGDADVQKTEYLMPMPAQSIITGTGFLGTLGKKTFSDYDPTTNANYFILSKKNGHVAFYYMSDTTLAANKAYYVYESTEAAPASLVFINNDTPTSISRPAIAEETDTETPIYDLTGRRVQGTLRPGIYVKNGRKILVK